MDLRPWPISSSVSVISCSMSGQVLDCRIAIHGDEKVVKFKQESFRGSHYWSSEQVYIEIPPTANQDAFYSNKVRKTNLAIQQEGEAFYLLTAFKVRNTVALIRSWVNSERGLTLAPYEAFDSNPIPIALE